MRLMTFGLSLAATAVAVPCLAETVDAPVHTVQLSKVILDTETTQAQGRIKGGTLCVFPSKLDLPKAKKTQDYERYDNLFSERMRASGFVVVTTSSDLFASADANDKADYLVGATIRPEVINLCSSVSGEKGDVTLAVDWQIYDKAAQKVVASITTEGQGAQEKFSNSGLTQMWNRAFTANLATLIANGAFKPYLGDAKVLAAPAPEAAPPTAPASGD